MTSPRTRGKGRAVANEAAGQAREYYDLLLAACRADQPGWKGAYRQMRTLLELLCRMQAGDGGLQLTDLAARVNYAAASLGLTTAELNRLHTFRLTSNDILNRRAAPERGRLLRDAKTLAFLVRRLTGADIPPELMRLLPRADATYVVSPPAAGHIRRLRATFLRRDDTYLYIRPHDRLCDEPLRVRHGVPQVNEEFGDTCRLLWPGAQLNLLDTAVDERGVLTPSLLVLEPDYLMDISTLAECFREYGHHPLNHVLTRLQPAGNTRPLLLGNIVNLFLDEWIHARTEPDYLACMRKAFRLYPVELAACADLQDPEKERQFFSDCRMHFDHLRRTVTETFRAPGYGLDRRDAVLEPSYLCEALGLHGRLDYLQRDLTAFIEMKSGRADEHAVRGKIVPKENNLVQMLLYQAVLEHTLVRDHHAVKPYLLYTRYPLLYPARGSWAMLRRVLDTRNRIVAGEHAVQRHNDPAWTARYLAALTPDRLNERGLTGRLWKDYLRPQIEAVRGQLDALTPLEADYFHTLYNFITRELCTSKSGDTDHEGHAGAASVWLSTLAEKVEAGEIIHGLRLADNRADDAQRPVLLLARPPQEEEEGTPLPNFRQGDAVILYERNTDADQACHKLVFRGTIEDITGAEVRIRLRSAQHNAAVLPAGSRYAVEHDRMDTAFRGMYRGLAAFLQATRRRRDLLLGQRPPEFDTSLDDAIAAAPDDFARITLKARAARDCFLLIGPPGTGKTSRALRGMVEAMHAEGKQLLLLSYTNRAVDEICRMLSAVTPPLDFIRLGGELACDERYRPHLMENALAGCADRRAVRRRIAACRVFVGTVATVSAKTELFRLKTFDVALVDEATQILEPQLLGLLCLRAEGGADAIGKFVLIGDHKQLPAVVLQPSAGSEVRAGRLRAIGMLNLKDSLFERLYRTWSAGGPEAGRAWDMLRRQGRMNEEVALFPNHAFYGGQLEPLGLPHQHGPLTLAPGLEGSEFAGVLARRVAFLPSVAEPAGRPAKVNHCEAALVARLAAAVHAQYAATTGFDPGRTLGVITPYRSQMALIRKELASTGIPDLEQVAVDTVERFQGSERDVIIYSFCVNHAWQLRFLSNVTEDHGVRVDRKLNVALTRARCQMYVTGVPGLLAQDPVYRALLRFLTGETGCDKGI